jgi:hypothetical protein
MAPSPESVAQPVQPLKFLITQQVPLDGGTAPYSSAKHAVGVEGIPQPHHLGDGAVRAALAAKLDDPILGELSVDHVHLLAAPA